MTVKQASQVLDLLQFFAARPRPASLADLSQQLGWPRSSTFNLVGTLVDRGFLYEPPARGGGYFPTPLWLVLAQQVAAAQPLPPALAGVLRDVVAATGETAVLAAPAGDSAVFLQVADSPHPVRYAAEAGKLVPIHATATGRALLSMYGPRERAALLGRLAYRRYTEATLMDAGAVQAAIDRGVGLGWFESAGGFTPDLGGVALPLRVDGRYYAVLAAGPVHRIAGRHAAMAQAIAGAIEARLPGIGLPVDPRTASPSAAGTAAAV